MSVCVRVCVREGMWVVIAIFLVILLLSVFWLCGCVGNSSVTKKKNVEEMSQLPVNKFQSSKETREAVLKKRFALTVEEKRKAFLAKQSGTTTTTTTPTTTTTTMSKNE